VLELRPSCENCNVALPPNSLDARICCMSAHFARLVWTKCCVTCARIAVAGLRRDRFGH